MTKRDYAFGIIPVMKTESGYEFLIIHSGKGHWTFPKGHKNDWETDLEAAKRELWEESGVTEIEIIPDVVFTTHYAVPPNEEGFEDKEVKLFLGIAKEKIAKVPADFEHEIIEARWCKPDEAAKLLDRIEWKNVLDDAKDYLLSHF